MASFKLYFPKLLLWEGTKLENVPGDNGSWTKDGIIISEYKQFGIDHNNDGVIDQKDLALMTDDEASAIAKINYWDKLKCDDITNQSLAEMICDFGFNTGIVTAAKKTQIALGNVLVDGIFGNKTILAINTTPQETLFNAIKVLRVKYYRDIVQNNPSQNKFLAGWLNRSSAFTFKL